MDIVIGSGPAGLSAATALLARGRHVTMIDGGKTLPPEGLARKTKSASTPADQWSQAQKDAWRDPQFNPSDDRVHRYGSNHWHEHLNASVQSGSDWLATRASHAVGGLSNVWGSAVLPNRQRDIEDWPITVEDLAPHYAAIGDLIPISGRNDALQDLFPALSMADRTPLKSGPQGRKLLARLDPLAEMLRASGIHIGQARQAVGSGCQYCGMCLHGCPWDQIYSAAHGLGTLKAHPNFTYAPGQLVRGFEDQGETIRVHVQNAEPLTAERLYIGAGVLETAQIVLRSALQPRPVKLKDSRHFFLPFLHSWSADEDPETTPHHTLTEAFIEIDDPSVSPYLTHSQIYGWNGFFAREMVSNYGKGLPGSASLFGWLSKRLMVAQTFLHSAHCDEIELSISRGGDTLSARLIENTERETVMRAVQTKLSRTMRKAGLHALGFAARLDAPGASFHSGGTFAMSATPSDLQTDVYGRLHGTKGVHIIDASVLPSIPATTITLSVMANAHRIGSVS